MKNFVLFTFLAALLGLVIPTSATVMADETYDNLYASVQGETNASAAYQAFAAKALEEGYPAIANLFRATSDAESKHAADEWAILVSMGATVRPVAEAPTVGTTEDNLQTAFDGETYEYTVMYPEFIAMAVTDDMIADPFNARRIFTLAMQAEEVHAVNYADVLANLADASYLNDTYSTVYRCPVCGEVVTTLPSPRCPICGQSPSAFIEYSKSFAEICGLLGHDWEEVSTPATCVADGFKTQKCKRCEELFGYWDYDEGSALGHVWDLTTTYKEGERWWVECTRDGCGWKGYIDYDPAAGSCHCDENGHVSSELLGDDGVKYKHQEATCTAQETWVASWYECVCCGEILNEYYGYGTPALGHDWDSVTWDGHGFLAVCKRCGWAGYVNDELAISNEYEINQTKIGGSYNFPANALLGDKFKYEIVTRPDTQGGAAPVINAWNQFAFNPQFQMPGIGVTLSRAGEYIVKATSPVGTVSFLKITVTEPLPK